MRALAIVGCVLLLCSCDQKADVDKKYPPPWRDGSHAEIAAALVKSNVVDCNQYKYRPALDIPDSFLVNCSEDGHAWRSYYVFTAAGTVSPTSTVDP